MENRPTYDLDTPDGMAAAIVALQRQLDLLAPISSWAVPEAMTVYNFNKPQKIAKRLVGSGSEEIELVLKAMGWTVIVNPSSEDE